MIGRAPQWRSRYAASGWCVTFAALHLYWAVGGNRGLASSAGADLATRRPALFVLVGLWGTAILLLLGAALGAALTWGRPRTRLRRLTAAVGWLVGAALLARGVVLEILLMTNAGGIATSVGRSETHWSLVLWNPWFIVGGVAFLVAARRSDPEPVPALFPGAAAPPGGSWVVDWITSSTRRDRTVTSAIPPIYARYATVVVPDGDTAKTLADVALVEVLRGPAPAQAWWLGYLDTGVADLVATEAPKVAVYDGWPYVLIDGGPEQALTARRNRDVTSWHSALPELVFPHDRSWLVSTMWDDDWRCVGGPAALVEALLLRADLQVSAVTLDQDATPPGRAPG